tara:strand:- start:1228 stop:1899 length:672 start_codon:yes stop_codon:yes gene_type:complete
LEKNNTINFDHWFFDLDNTLYCANSGIFDQIHERMSLYISKKLNINIKEAKFLQKKYFIENGTTLHGLMLNHKIKPEEFLYFVHDINFDVVKPDEKLNKLIKKIAKKKIIFTNADMAYVEKILNKLKLDNVFYDIFDIKKMDYIPKPNVITYKKLINTYKVKTYKAILFDDIPQNLITASKLGLKTVQVYNKKLDKELNGRSKKIDYMTNNLKEFLQKWITTN